MQISRWTNQILTRIGILKYLIEYNKIDSLIFVSKILRETLLIQYRDSALGDHLTKKDNNQKTESGKNIIDQTYLKMWKYGA